MLKRPAKLMGKLLATAVLTLLALEGGVRLASPVDRFDYIPNTFDPVCQIRMLPHAHGFIRCPEFAMEIHTNGGGLREDREIPYAKPPGTLRILCLGDSFTVGYGVDAGQTYAAQIQAILPGCESINAGVGGTGTANQLAWFTQEGWRYGPDIVLIAPVVNDFLDNTTSGLFTFAADSSLVQHAAVQSRTLRILRLLRRIPGYTSWFQKSHFFNAVRQAYAVRHSAQLAARAAGNAPPAEVGQSEDALMHALLRQLRRECEARGAALVVMPVPALSDSPEQPRLDALYDWLAREAFALVDLRPAFAAASARGQRLYYPIDNHWTAAGHRLAASEFARLAWRDEERDAR